MPYIPPSEASIAEGYEKSYVGAIYPGGYSPDLPGLAPSTYPVIGGGVYITREQLHPGDSVEGVGEIGNLQPVPIGIPNARGSAMAPPEQIAQMGMLGGIGASLFPADATNPLNRWLGQQLGIGEQVRPGDSPEGTSAGLTSATVARTLVGLGSAGAVAGAAFGISKIVGMVYPWESATGEGFIAPWTPKIRDENGLWVSAKTRPDLFGGNRLGEIDGKTVVKSWDANGWPFSLTSDGWIYTINKSGVMRRYKPRKPIVLVRGSTKLSDAVTAQRYLDRMWKSIAKRTKQLKLS